MKRATFLKASLISKGIIATCAIVGFLMQMTLHGWHGLRYYTNQSNLLVGVFMVYLLFDKGHCYKWYDPFTWTLLPLVYAIVSVAIALTTRIPIGNNKDGPFPYFFLNVDKYGFVGVLQYCLGLAVAFLIGSYILFVFKNGFKTKERL